MQSFVSACTTTLAQAFSESKSSTYRQICIQDEFDCFYDRRFQRCRVVSRPRVEGGRVEFQIVPVSNKYYHPQRVCFVAEAQVEIYLTRTPVQRKGERKSPAAGQRQEERILSVLQRGWGVRTARQIADLVTLKHGAMFNYPTLNPNGF